MEWDATRRGCTGFGETGRDWVEREATKPNGGKLDGKGLARYWVLDTGDWTDLNWNRLDQETGPNWNGPPRLQNDPSTRPQTEFSTPATPARPDF